MFLQVSYEPYREIGFSCAFLILKTLATCKRVAFPIYQGI